MITAYWEYFIQQVNSIEVNTVSSIFKLSLSLLLGCLVGFERKRKGQIAGVRTFALISMGATLAMILSIYVPQEYLGLKNGDPGRIAAQVVTGIGFLGAGAIIQMKSALVAIHSTMIAMTEDGKSMDSVVPEKEEIRVQFVAMADNISLDAIKVQLEKICGRIIAAAQ